MVNEAFITEIQSGNREHLEELWDSVRPFVERQARRRVRACQNGGAYCGTEVEDLIQDGFLAFLRAAETYQGGGRMTFLGWLDLHLKNAFNEALGVRRVRDYREPIRWAVNESLAKLPVEWRRIMVRRYWMGQTLQQIAAAEGKSHQAISAKENSALRRMRKRDVGGRLAEFACQF